MRLFVVLAICLLGAAAAEMNFDEEMAEIEKLDQQLAELTPDDKEAKEDFLLGLVHHAVRGVLGAAHGLINFVGHVAGDDVDSKLDQVLKLKPEMELVPVDGTTEQEKKDFILGLLHTAARGVVGAAHGLVHLAGHILLGDEKADNFHFHVHYHNHHGGYGGYGGYGYGYHHGYGYYGDMSEKEKADFLFGLIHHAVRGVLNVAHHAVNFVGHVLGDEDAKDVAIYSSDGEAPKEDFLLGLVHHYVKGCVGVLHHAVNFVGGVLGDEDAKDFRLGLIQHNYKNRFGPSHHYAVNFVGHVLGDEDAKDFLPPRRSVCYIPPPRKVYHFIGDEEQD